jgi:thioredoxin reductase
MTDLVIIGGGPAGMSAAVAAYESGITDIEIRTRNIQLDCYYSIESYQGNRKITYYISNQKPHSEYQEAIEFSYKNSNCWFVIKDIQPISPSN